MWVSVDFKLSLVSSSEDFIQTNYYFVFPCHSPWLQKWKSSLCFRLSHKKNLISQEKTGISVWRCRSGSGVLFRVFSENIDWSRWEQRQTQREVNKQSKRHRDNERQIKGEDKEIWNERLRRRTRKKVSTVTLSEYLIIYLLHRFSY